ncbi:MAG: hypothetical protein F4X26_04220 [Chloroflexi bacterium]|nr:hypothetical protein [Chloroflexota bacterium]
MRRTRTALRKVRGLTLLLAVTAFSMVGCIRYELGFVVNNDGSGTMSVLLAISDQISAMTGMTTEDALPLDPSALPGTAVEEYSQDGFSGMRVTVPFASLQQLGFFMGTEQADALTNEFDLRPDGAGGWSFSTVLVPATEAAGPAADQAGALPPELLQGGWARIRVQLPGTIAEHNADRVEGGVLIWDIDLTSTEPRTLTATTTGADAGSTAAPETGHGILATDASGSGAGTLAAVAIAAVVVVVASRALTGRRREVRR